MDRIKKKEKRKKMKKKDGSLTSNIEATVHAAFLVFNEITEWRPAIERGNWYRQAVTCPNFLLPLTHLLCFYVQPLYQFRVNNLHNVCKSPARHLGNQVYPSTQRYNLPDTVPR